MTSSRRIGRKLFAAACAVLVVLAIVGAVRRFGSERDREPETSGPATSGQATGSNDGTDDASLPVDGVALVAGPTVVSDGIPAGFTATIEGARAAAVGWVASLPALIRLGPIAFEQTLSERLSQRALAAGAIGQIATVRDQLSRELGADPARFTVTDSPLTVTGELTSPTTATVSVWAALVTASTPDAPVQVQYRTHVLTFVWEADDWRLDEIAFGEGPTPSTVDGQAPTGFDEYVTVAGWVPAIAAGLEQE